MRTRTLWIGSLSIIALLIAGWLLMRRTNERPTTDSVVVAGSGSGASPRTAPALPDAGGSAGSGVASFECTRPSSDAARVDGVAISLERLCTTLAKLGAVTKAGVDRQQARLALDRLVNATLVKRALELQHAAVSEADVELARAALPGAQAAEDPTVLKEQLRERLELEKLTAIRAGIEVSDQDVDAELASGAPGIDRGQGLRVEAWIARVADGAAPEQREAARKAAEGFAAAVKTTAPDAAAKQHSMSALPSFVLTSSGLEPEMEAAALSMRKGEWSPAVKTRVGWTVVRAVEPVEGTKLDDKALRLRVQQALVTRKLGAAKQRVLEELRAASKIEILIEL